jgi:hypothetical protein
MLVDSFRETTTLCTQYGRLALHLGLENGWLCHDVLLNGAPNSLHRRDPKTEMYPFQLAPSRHRSAQVEEPSG